ncbi:MAG: hypothetical protein Q7R30_23865 [Acidobacteriota bacterium]|nr:hypothetical protein [Acidobacteriota bacterium]
MSRYLDGTAVLGLFEPTGGLASVPSTSTPPTQYIVFTVKNLPEVVAKEGGSAGAVAFKAVPQTIENMAYGKIRDELKTEFGKKGVNIDVQTTYVKPVGGRPPNDLLVGATMGAASVGVGYGLWKLVKYLTK